MYICIYTTTGASYPPHPMGGGGGGVGTRDTGPYIYMGYDGLPVICIYIYLSLSIVTSSQPLSEDMFFLAQN